MTFDHLLREACPGLGLEWRKYRRRAARHRLDARLRELGLADYGAYLDILRADPAEAARLADLLLVTVSRFFRDREAWRDLECQVLPALFDEKPVGPLRVWSAGCCGGEEPYSLAILWLDRLRPLNPDRSIGILATDIDWASLERARLACYGAGSLRELPQELRQRWFVRQRGSWLLDGRVTQLVRFEARNLMTDTLPAGQDLVLCRYLAFTYYRDERVMTAARRLWEALRPGGVLMTGRKEGLPPDARGLLEPWPGCVGFYRRRG